MNKDVIITGITVKEQMEMAINILNKEIIPIMPKENTYFQRGKYTSVNQEKVFRKRNTSKVMRQYA